mmetsp:Transcript_15221/g.30855  ORF Transcript_15221/g.30855 Transcript_15221/m.30855 type:complete len:119 (+) Transcript_15221:89-445(+)
MNWSPITAWTLRWSAHNPRIASELCVESDVLVTLVDAREATRVPVLPARLFDAPPVHAHTAFPSSSSDPFSVSSKTENDNDRTDSGRDSKFTRPRYVPTQQQVESRKRAEAGSPWRSS